MQRLKIILTILVFVIVPFVPMTVLAVTPASSTPAASSPPAPTEKACTSGCWCTSKEGAKKLPTSLGTDACSTACKKAGERMVACAFKIDQLPERSPYCFTKSICTKQNGIFDTKQAIDCIPGQNYCFPDPEKAEKVKLNVAIPNPINASKPLTITGNIGEYINAFFTYIVYTGMVIAIVMVMVGGLQYTLGASSKDGVSKGKKRITNGVTGFVLLLCVNLIASTVNPYLIKLKVPKFPMVKRIDLVTATSCETMEAEYILKAVDGTDIAADQKKCGTSATIVSKKDGGSVAGATSCDYTKCPEKGQGCLGTGENAKCLACAEVKPGAPGILPSEETCQKLKLPDSKKTIDGKEFSVLNYCSYTHDTDALFSSPAWTASKNAFLTITPVGWGLTALTAYLSDSGTAQKEDIERIVAGTCGSVSIDCSKINKCEDYDDKVSFTTAFTSAELDDMQEGTLVTGSISIHSVCKENPCAVTKGGKIGTNCDIEASNVLQTNCVSSAGQLQGAKNGCEGMSCSKGGNKCVTDPVGNPICAACGDLVDNNKLAKDGSVIVPTPALCNKYDTPFNRCIYTTEAEMTSFKDNKFGSCAEVAIDCSTIDSCDDYDGLDAKNAVESGEDLEDLNTLGNKTVLKTVCESNPCATQIKHACKYDGGSDCEDP